MAELIKEALVVERQRLIDFGYIPDTVEPPYHYRRFNEAAPYAELSRILDQFGHYGPRGGDDNIETNPSLQQPIFYGYILRSDGRFLVYERTAQHTDDRLSSKVALGLGGHIERYDQEPLDSLYREIIEETHISWDGKTVDFDKYDGDEALTIAKTLLRVTPRGAFKDERDPVGEVHFGVSAQVYPRNSTIILEPKMGNEGGESARWWYLNPAEYNLMLSSGDIVPEGWADVIYKEEILKRK